MTPRTWSDVEVLDALAASTAASGVSTVVVDPVLADRVAALFSSGLASVLSSSSVLSPPVGAAGGESSAAGSPGRGPVTDDPSQGRPVSDNASCPGGDVGDSAAAQVRRAS